MSDADNMARDARAGYIAWCRGEVPAKMAGADFDRMIARIKAEAVGEAARGFALSPHVSYPGTAVHEALARRADQIEEEAGQAAALGEEEGDD